jgi:hypothetical protein
MKRWGMGCAALLAAAGAQAESARMSGKFAPPYREAGMLRSIGIDRIGGRDGRQLEMAIERALSVPDVDGRPHFDLIAAFGGGRGPEGVLGGHVNSAVQDSRFKRKEKRCAEKKDGRCLREEEVELDCTRRVMTVNADLRLTRLRDGRILYTVAKPWRNEISWCQGQTPPGYVEDAFRGMILDIAVEVRRDIAPVVEDYSIRFRESTRGLPKPLERPFKDIVRQTQRDLRGACSAWQTIDAQAPDHPSVVFDLGLCAEAAGDYAGAMALYRRAAPLIGRGGNEATAGVERVGRLIAAREDDAARGR